MSDDYRPTAEEDSQRLAQTPETAPQWAERGAILLDRRQYQDAVDAFSKALALEPRDDFSLAARGMARAELRDFDAAARDYHAAEAIKPGTDAVARGRARLAEMLGKYDEALRHYNQALEKAPDDDFLLGRRAIIFEQLGDHASALRDSARALKQFPDWERLYALRAEIFEKMGDRDQAIAQATALIAAGSDEDSLWTATNIYRRFGRHAEALRTASRVIEIAPSADNYVGRHHVRRWSDIAGRKADIDDALRLDPRNNEALAAKAILQIREKDAAAAISTLAPVLKTGPGDSDLLATRGHAYLLAGKPLDAARDFAAARRAARDAGDFNAICWTKGIAGTELAGALEDCDRAIAKAPDHYAPLDSRALILLKMGRPDEAIVYYDRALVLDPLLSESLYGRALARAAKGQMAKAAADRAAALALDPDIEESYRFYGLDIPTALVQAKPEVVDVPKAEARVVADQPLARFTQRGMEMLDDNDLDGARAAFEAALAQNPDDSVALAGRGFIHVWNEDLTAAQRDLDRAAVLAPQDSYVLRSRGYLAQNQKRYSDALKFYTRVIQQEPDDQATYGWRAEVYRLIDDKAAAIRDSEMATKLNPRWPDMYFLRARIYQETGQAAKAIAEARRAITASPRDVTALHQAAIIYKRNGNRAEALKTINQAIAITPSADLFIGRMFIRAVDDVANRRLDVEAALRVEPTHQTALREMAFLQDRTGDPAGAATTLSIALREMPGNSQLLALRAELLSQSGRKEEAARDFAAARAAARHGDDIDLLCWNHALTDIDLPAALRDCEAALAQSPNAPITLESLGLVQLKLDRIDDAVLSYGRALAIEPDHARSLYGRAVAWKRKGDAAKAENDRKAAIKIDADIAETMRKGGLTM